MGSMLRATACVAALLSSACGGVAWVSDEEQCQGVHCDVICSVNAECPAGTVCELGRCSRADGFDDQGNPIDPDGGPNGGDGDGTGDTDGADGPDFGDNPFAGDDGGDSVLGGDTVSGGDLVCVPGAPEVCNDFDDNCDGNVDEGVTNPCGNCLPYPFCITGYPPYCEGNNCIGNSDGGVSGPITEGDLPPPNETDGTVLIDLTPNPAGDGFGSITLATGSVSTDFAWPASESHGTVSRVDTVNKREVGRYASVLIRGDDVRNPYVADYDHTPNVGPRTACAEPSRSTIDELGNAYIANRAAPGYSGRCDNENNAPNQMGSVTKVAYFNAQLCDGQLNPGLIGCQCVDRNGDGFIQTSHDYDEPPNGIQPATCSGDCTSVTVQACTGAKCNVPCSSTAECGSGFFCAYNKDATPVGTVEHRWRCSTTRTIPEFLGKDDECLLWTRRIPAQDHDGHRITSSTFNGDNDFENDNDGDQWRSAPRAMAIDKQGYIWVGAHYAAKAFKLRPDGEFVYPRDPDGGGSIQVNDLCPATLRYAANGNAVPTGSRNDCLTQQCYETIPDGCWVDLSIFPYGAVIDSGRTHPDRFGYVWFSDYGYPVERVDTQTGTAARAKDSPPPYGITIDHADRPWTAHYESSEVPRINRYTLANPIGNGAWTSFVPSACVGEHCDTTCTQDSDCNALPAGYRKCSANLGGGSVRGCTKECTQNKHCAPDWGTVCMSGVCTWDGDDDQANVSTWRGRGVTTELISSPSECLAQGDNTPPCSRVWGMFHNVDYNDGSNNDPNWLFAFDADTGREIISLRRRMDRNADSFSPGNRPNAVNGVDNLCSGAIGVGVGLGGLIWSANYADDSVCGYDPLNPDYISAVSVDLNPYTYSDFTGNIFRSFTNPQGKYRVLVKACQDPLILDAWGKLEWIADVSAQAKLEVRLRFGATIGEASNPVGAQIGPTISAAGTDVLNTIQLPEGEARGWLEIEFNFVAGDDGTRPVLDDVNVVRSCKLDE